MKKRRIATFLALWIVSASLAPWTGTPAQEPGEGEKTAPAVSKEEGEENLIRQRHEWFYGPRRAGSGGKMAELRQAAVEFTRAQEELGRTEAGGEGAGVWTARGPFSSTFGGWTFGNVAGRIPAIAKDFANNILYVGSASGGLWKSTNDGASWTPLLDAAGTLTLGEIEVDPQTPSTLWVGTGENTAWCEDYFGIGLLRSTDGGITWQLRNGSGGTSLRNLSAFASIVIHPTNSSRLVVGGRYRDCVNGNYYSGGIFSTDDAGATWTERLPSVEVTEIVTNPADPSILWAGCGNSGLYKSEDGGNTWTLQTSLPTGSVRRVEVAIAPSDPSTMYVLFESASGSPRFYQSTDGGTTWTQKSSGTSACDGQCGYNMVLRVHVTQPNTVYRGTIKIYKSTDGGATWSDLIGSWGGSQKVHQDIHEFLMDPANPNAFYVGCDGGIWKTSDGGGSFANLNGNLSLTQFYDVGNHPTDDGVILGGAQDNSSLARTTGDTWGLQQVTGDGFVCAINPSTPSTCYIAGYPYNHGSGTVPSVFRSTSGVWGPFSFITDVSDGIASTNRIAWVTPYTLDPNSPNILFLGTSRAYRSTDGGTRWTGVGPSDMAGGSGTVSTLHVSRAGSSWVYGGTSSGRIWRSVDGGNNWSDISSGLPGSRAINDIDSDPTDGTRAFCVVSGFNTAHLYEYDGSSWAARGAGLPNVPANAVLALSATEVLVGTDTGVFRSTDGGATFAPFNSGLPAGLVVTDLEVSPYTATVTAGTYGRGAFQITLGTPACFVNCSTYVPLTGKAGVGVSFTSAVTPHNCSGSPSYAWTFGDGAASAQQSPTHTYAAAGTYAWSYTVTVDGKTCSGSGTITVEPPCVVDCTATVPGTGNALVPVSFSGTASPSACSGSPAYAWTFGDGATSNQQNPSHAYASEGSYTWTLTVTVAGVTCTQSGTIAITPPCSLTCTAAVPASGGAGAEVAFSATAVPTNCTSSPTYLWSFGDGTSSVQKNATHTYTSGGVYPWSLTVSLQGLTCSQQGSITIVETCALSCTATVPAAGTAGEPVPFQGAATATNCVDSPAYAWAFGDGGTSSEQNPSHTFVAPGTYAWALTVTADGKACSQAGTVTVAEPCTLTCDATAEPASGVAPLTVAFAGTAEATACDGNPAFSWDFGDGATSPLHSPTHRYAEAGTYAWTLTVTVEGISCTKTGTVTVEEPCVLACAASASPVQGTLPLAVQFSASAETSHCADTPSYSWDFGDGYTSAQQNPSHAYQSVGTFTWFLFVTADGQTCAKTGSIDVVAPCTVACVATAAPQAGKAPLEVTFTSSATPSNCAGNPTYAWAFGDGGTSSEPNPTHAYAVAGDYSWSLTVTVDGAACERSGIIAVEARVPGDANGDGVVSIGEVQQAINMFLGTQPPGNGVDCNGDGSISIGEVQKVINAFLGIARSC